MKANARVLSLPAVKTLAVELGGSASDAFWAGTVYLLACAVAQPVLAALSDIFGRRALLLLSLACFTAGTLVCAPVARAFPVLFAGRAVSQPIRRGFLVTQFRPGCRSWNSPPRCGFSRSGRTVSRELSPRPPAEEIAESSGVMV